MTKTGMLAVMASWSLAVNGLLAGGDHAFNRHLQVFSAAFLGPSVEWPA
jgi:hypothetical protein